MFECGLSTDLAGEGVMSLWVQCVQAGAFGVCVLAEAACVSVGDWCVGAVAQCSQVVFARHVRGGICRWVHPRRGSLSAGGTCDCLVCWRHCCKELGVHAGVDVLHYIFLRVFRWCANPMRPVDVSREVGQ